MADASHELRTPLTALAGFLDLWAAGNLDPEEARTSLAAMRRETSRMTRLIQQLLRLSHFDQEGAQALNASPHKVETLLDDLVPTLQALAPGRLVLNVEPVEIWADRDRFAEVILNLVDNAVRHGRGQVTVSARPGPLGAELTVEDEGAGLSPEVAQHLFERFYRADPSRARSGGGAGLGLSIVASLVEAHGGRIRAGNRPAGGARFTVDWPNSAPAPRSSPPSPPASTSRPAGAPPRGGAAP